MKSYIFPFFVNLTLLAVVINFVLIFGYFFFRNFLRKILIKQGFFLIFLVSFLAMIGSLSFSEVLGWAPCKLCWYQRVFMYPQIFIAGISYFAKNNKGYLYHYWLSIFGFLIALFHYLTQWGLIKNIDCNLASTFSNCIKINFVYGFISIPFMAMMAFLTIILVSIFSYENKKSHS